MLERGPSRLFYTACVLLLGNSRSSASLSLVAALFLGAVGLLLLIDRPGLRTGYMAITPHWDRPPVHSRVTLPRVDSVQDVEGILVSHEIFSLRWRGWIDIREPGLHTFRIAADESSYLHVGGESLIAASDSSGKRRRSAERHLEKGSHPVEVGVSQTGRDARLALSWVRPDSPAERIPAESFFAHRPVWAFRWLRHLVRPLSVLQRQFLGCFFLLVALLVGSSRLRSRGGVFPAEKRMEWQPREGGNTGTASKGAFLLVLFVGTWLATVPFTTDTLDGDDVRYLDAAYHGKKMTWIVNRYVHVYLLRVFFWLEGGDAFRGARSMWSFLFAATVTALAAAVLTLGPRLQWRTLGVVLFLLVSQFSLMGSIGAVYPDYTVMMFVTMALAVYLHGIGRSAQVRWDWHAMALGVLTVLAFRSKETGFIITWLAVPFLWHQGKIHIRMFLTRSMAWIVGAGLALVALMSLDALLLGDFWFGLRPSSYQSLRDMMSAAGARTHQPVSLWLNVLIHGHPRGGGIGFAMRNLWILVGVGAVSAFVHRKRIELRVLYLMPAVYLVMLFILRPPIFSTRHIWPILPAACLAGGMLAFDCGLEEWNWRRLFAPRLLIPLFAAVALTVLVLGPMKTGELPVSGQAWVAMVTSVLGILLALGTAVLFLRRSDRSLLSVTLCLLLFFGPGLYLTHHSLSRHTARQRGELTLYPWRAFETEIRHERPRSIQVSPRLLHKFQMVGRRKTRALLARVFFGRRWLRLVPGENLRVGLPMAVGSKRDLKLWLEQASQMAGSEVTDATGQFFLVRPRAATSPNRAP